MMKACLKVFDDAVSAGNAIPSSLFDASQTEIYKIIDKDSFSRFKKNDNEINELCDALFRDCDIDNSGLITLEEYQKWVDKNPDAMNFIKELNDHSNHAVEKVRNSVYFRKLSHRTSGTPSEEIMALRKKYSRRCLDQSIPEDDDEFEEFAKAEGDLSAEDLQRLGATSPVKSPEK
jgi:hypothetical protein